MNGNSGAGAELVHLSFQAESMVLAASFNPFGARQVSLTHNGRNALQPYDLAKTPPFATGFVMAPWANRMRDGSWTDAHGTTHQNPVSEASTNTALHGLLLNTVYEVELHCNSSVTFSTRLNSTDGYPFDLSFSVQYSLTEHGLTATHRATNHSPIPAPFQTGAHPYLYIDGFETANLELQVPASHWWKVDQRLLPVGIEPVEGTNLDARKWVRLGDFCIDNGFTGLQRGEDGLARTVVRAPLASGDKRAVAVWQDAAFPQVHVFSTPLYPATEIGNTVHGITIEPVTAGPDAFNTYVDLIELSPEVEWQGSWGIQLLDW